METRKTYTYKLKPTPEQDHALWSWLHACRHLYNCALEQRQIAWHCHRVSVTRFAQEAELKDLRVAFPEFAAVHSHVLQDVIARLDKAFQAFFRRVKAGETPGYPRFQGVNRSHSFTFKEYGNGAKFDNGFLILSKIGRVAVRWSRPLEGVPKTVTLSHEADGWYVGVSCDAVPTTPLPLTGQEIGIDVGLAAFLTTNEGEKVANPRPLRTAERRLKKAHRRVSRGQKGSHRRRKKVKLLAKHHQTVRRQRRDFFFKLALDLVRRYDVIVYEDLVIRNMVKNHHLAKSISDAGWGEFLSILACKAAWAGKTVIAVPPAYTSQDCSRCGERVPKSLSVRTHVCPACGLMLDRDENAARNILQRAGQARRGLVGLPAGVNRESAPL